MFIPQTRDSLMRIESGLITVNPMAYLFKNRIVVKDFVLERPDIYAYVDSSGKANWNIVKETEEVVAEDSLTADSTGFNGRLRLKNVRIRDGK